MLHIKAITKSQEGSRVNYINDHFSLKSKPAANKEAIVTFKNVRFTILTSRIIRIEYSSLEKFEDRASYVFWNRHLPVPEFTVNRSEGSIEIITRHLTLHYNISFGGLSAQSLYIKLNGCDTVWNYGDPENGNLGGTISTLDSINGSFPLDKGLMSADGYCVIDDTYSMIFNDKGWIQKRPHIGESEYSDLYFFGYGREYIKLLDDYYKIAGKAPLIPRWALGNWWSRYWNYTQDEHEKVVNEFKAYGIPLSVLVIDMDWHITKNEYHRGWTGYTWDKKLYPEHRKFLKWLHDIGLKVTLNLHPADGVHPHEEMYPKMAEFMGIDPESKQPVEFDIADPKFTKAYFEILHHPHEEEGVDFWWMDWQQGEKTKLEGLKPLPWINHLHFLDLGRDGVKRPFNFTRWGGLGSHRYPIGFSGDTFATWESLAFQPYFTASSANVGYNWWSHDIGGHMGGFDSKELYTRWVQYGAFSPILRLHGNKNAYSYRQPWDYDEAVLADVRTAMQLRCKLIPYLYSMAYKDYTSSIPAIKPMYYNHPENEEAYVCPNQYYYGSELIAAPFTSPLIPDLNMSRQVVWIPEDGWFNFFSGELYNKGFHAIYGTMKDIPVFAKPGAIVPLDTGNIEFGVNNPHHLAVNIFPGADNEFLLYEDDGETTRYLDGKSCLTVYSQKWLNNRLEFRIFPAEGDTSLIPEKRTYTLFFKGIKNPDDVRLLINGEFKTAEYAYDDTTETLALGPVMISCRDNASVILVHSSDTLISGRERTAQTCRKILRHSHMDTTTKRSIDHALAAIFKDISELSAYLISISDIQAQALIEVISKAGVCKVESTGRDIIIMWNNKRSEAFTYNFSWWRPRLAFPAEKGTIPGFRCIIPEKDYPDYSWRLCADYTGIISICYENLSMNHKKGWIKFR